MLALIIIVQDMVEREVRDKQQLVLDTMWSSVCTTQAWCDWQPHARLSAFPESQTLIFESALTGDILSSVVWEN